MNYLVKNLSKGYSSGFRLGPIDLSIQPGEIVGLLGPNGAGKTTLIRLLLGVLRPDTGSGNFLGLDVRSHPRIRQRIGYLDEEPIHYDWMKIRWLASFYSSYFPSWDQRTFDTRLKSLALDQRLRLGQLSKGSKVRLGFALALAHTPSLLLLDEPTSSLDPIVRREVLTIIAGYVHENPQTMVLFSSHITSDLEQICNRVLMMEKGHIISDLSIRSDESPRTAPQAKASLDLSLEDTFLQSVSVGETCYRS